MKTIITILDSLAETSMPFNEFVLYRANHIKDEQQVLIICNNPGYVPKVDIPKKLEIKYIGNNPLKWRKSLLAILSTYEGKEYAIHLHQAGPSMKILLVMLGTNFSKKVVFTVHSTFTGYKLHNKIRSYTDGLLSRYVVCCSNVSYDKYPTSLKRLKGNRVLAIQNGVDTERIDNILAHSENSEHDGVIFAYVARMIPLKNHNFLIDFAKQTSPKAKFLLIGKEDKKIVQRIRTEGLSEKIEVTGLIPRKEVFEKLHNADVYLSTSTLEGLPVSVLEGMYVGLPAILSDISQHKEVSMNNDFVKILEFNKDKWIKTINYFAEMPPKEIHELGNKCKDYVEGHFSLKVMHNLYDSIYYNLMKDIK